MCRVAPRSQLSSPPSLFESEHASRDDFVFQPNVVRERFTVRAGKDKRYCRGVT